MNKRKTIWGSIIILFLVVLTLLICQVLVFLVGEDYIGSPALFGVYTESGTYEINPETLLEKLDQGETDLFTPFFGDWNRDEPYYDSITWTQADYIKIANALSLEIWNEPLDLENWRIIDIDFIGRCENNPSGFHTFTIAYYKALGISNWERKYTTRLIEVYSWLGLVHLGTDAVYSSPLLLGWDGVDLTQFIIMANDALQIAEKNGGLDARRRVDNSCRIMLTVNQLSPLPHRVRWLVDYDRADLYMHVNPYTGKHKILNTDQ